MRLVNTNIRDFKSVETLDFSLGSALTILTGPNNAGKSAILQALRMPQLLRGEPWSGLGAPVDLVTDYKSSTVPVVTARVRFEPNELQNMHASFRDNTPNYFTMRFSLVVGPGAPQVILDSIERDGAPQSIWARSNNTYLFVGENGGQNSSNIGHDVVENQVRLGLTNSGRWIALDPVRLLLQKMFFYDPFRTIGDSMGLAGPPILEPTGYSLPRLLFWHSSQDPRFAAYCRLVEALAPGLGTLITPLEPNGNTFLGFRRNDVIIKATTMGTGIQQLLVLAYHLVAKEAAVLFLEEPESHLHPTAQRALFRAIREASEWCQIVLSTHSPLFIDRVVHENDWVVSLNENSRTVIQPLKHPDPFRPVRELLGTSLGDTLYAGDVILVVEGPTEQTALPRLSELARSASHPYIDFEKVAVVSSGGTGNLKSILRILQGFAAPILVLVDDDENARRATDECVVEGLVPAENVLFVGSSEHRDRRPQVEFEDLLPAEAYLAAVNERYGTSFDKLTYESAMAVLTKQRNGHAPPRTHVYRYLLQSAGKVPHNAAYDKVGVALGAVNLMSAEDIPQIVDLIAARTRELVGTPPVT